MAVSCIWELAGVGWNAERLLTTTSGDNGYGPDAALLDGGRGGIIKLGRTSSTGGAFGSPLVVGGGGRCEADERHGAGEITGQMVRMHGEGAVLARTKKETIIKEEKGGGCVEVRGGACATQGQGGNRQAKREGEEKENTQARGRRSGKEHGQLETTLAGGRWFVVGSQAKVGRQEGRRGELGEGASSAAVGGRGGEQATDCGWKSRRTGREWRVGYGVEEHSVGRGPP
ncbi:hypothetical protein GQ53DRAFT_165501 [Thozetella sp. PMI_491]|nr:hypothetical protein GQ53DRAFT_165501 [Thozetella sp. PMI_491]